MSALPLLPEATPRVVFIGSGTRGPFDFTDGGTPIRVQEQAQLVVRRYSSTTDEDGTLLVLNTDYTVDNTDVDDVSLTLTSAQDVLTSLERLVVERTQDISGVIAYAAAGNFSGPNLSNAIGKVSEQLQELRRDVDRRIASSALDTTPPTFPLKANASAGNLLAFDADKNLQPVAPTDIGISSALLGSGWLGLLTSPAASILDNLSGIRAVATYAALTALVANTGLADNAVYFTYGRDAEEDGGAGFWRYDSASTATANGGTILAIDGGGAGRFFRLYTGAIQARWFTPFDNSTDETTTLQAAITAATNAVLELPPATALCNGGLTGVSGITIKGVRGVSTIKRKNSAGASTSVLRFAGKSGFALKDFVIDGNKANQSNAATSIVIESSCYDFHLDHIETKNAKAVGGSYGGGITIADNADAANDTTSTLTDVSSHDNDTYQTVIARCTAIDVIRHVSNGSANAGLSIQDFTLPVPGSPTNKRIQVFQSRDLGSPIGLEVFGFRSGQSGGVDIGSADDFVTKGLVVVGWQASSCSTYGLAVQADCCAIIAPIIEDCGSDTSNGGLLFNAGHSVLVDPIITGSYYYGADCGGMYYSQVINPMIRDTGASINQGIALNYGAARHCKIVGGVIDTFGGDGTGGGSYGLFGSRFDGSSNTNWLPWSGDGIEIVGVTVHLRDTDHVGISCVQGYLGAHIHDNNVIKHAAGTAYQLRVEPSTSRVYNNRQYDPTNDVWESTVASASTFVYPDGSDEVIVSGTTQIEIIRSASMHAMHQCVAFVYATANGSNYAAGDTVSFSGGGGANAAATLVRSADGRVWGAYVTNHGDGNYSSAPTVSITTSTGSGATLVAAVTMYAPYRSRLRMHFSDAAVVDNGGDNVYLNGSDFTPSAFGLSTLDLKTQFGNYYETGRAAN